MRTKSKQGQRYIRITDTVFESVAFRTLPGSAAKLWLDLRAQYYGTNNGALLVTPKVLERRGWNSPVKLIKAKRELLHRGLIKHTRKYGQNQFHRADLFAFTDLDVQRNDGLGIDGSQATHDYLTWTGNAAKCVVPKQNQYIYRNGSETASESVGRNPETATESVQRRIGPEAAPVLAFGRIVASR